MDINKWIKDYASENEIDIPSGIGDVNTCLNFLQLNKVQGGGGSSEPPTITFLEGTEGFACDFYFLKNSEILQITYTLGLNDIEIGEEYPIAISTDTIDVCLEKELCSSITGSYEEITINEVDYYKITGSISVVFVD